MAWLLILALGGRAGGGAGAADGDPAAAFDAFLDGAVTEGGVDYALLATRRALLDEALARLAAAPVETLSAEARLATYVNAYNACTLRRALDGGAAAGTLTSLRDLDGGNPWATRTCVVGGRSLTLDEIEHAHARELADGRVHAVLNCASRGCPPLPPRALRPAGIEGQLDEAARRWARHNACSLEGSALRLSRVFDWYGDDFVSESEGDLPGLEGKAENAVWFLLDKVEADVAARLKSGTLEVGWLEYDWGLNRR